MKITSSQNLHFFSSLLVYLDSIRSIRLQSLQIKICSQQSAPALLIRRKTENLIS